MRLLTTKTIRNTFYLNKNQNRLFNIYILNQIKLCFIKSKAEWNLYTKNAVQQFGYINLKVYSYFYGNYRLNCHFCM